jgi:signal transduction histidine kinase
VRRRLMLAMVGLVAVTLVVAGVGGLLLTRKQARDQAQSQLVSEANSFSSSKLAHAKVDLKLIKRTLRLEDADVVTIGPEGHLITKLRHGLTATDLDVPALQNGDTVSGRIGDLVYAVAPVQLTAEERARLRPDESEDTFTILLTRNVGDLGPSWGYFIVAGGAALAIAALVAWQISQRIARPLIEAEEVTGRIAAGELTSRIPARANDYPELASLAGSINDMAQSLEDSRARERHLLLAVSHDLRTPLTSIRGFAEAIQDGAIDDSSHAADVIIAEARRLERLVGDLLDLTKLEARQMSIAMRPTDAVEVVSTTAEGFRPAAAKSGLQIVIQAPPDDGPQPTPFVAADPDRLAQLLANLIENALTYASTTVAVNVTDFPEVGACIITVDDDGPGIAPGDLSRVFERFYRADRGPNRRLGSGLGLAIVAELAAAMGGSVRAESPLRGNGGSRFLVTLSYWRGAVLEPARV